MTTRAKSIRAKGFMVRPEDGWLHDSTALASGAGIFYSFPVRYIGSLQVLQSLNGLNIDQKTEICQEAIARCIEFSNIRKKNVKRKTSKFIKDYLADAPYIKVMDLKLNVSAQGLATSEIATNNVISLDEITKISFASGGQLTDYDFVTYVAKDKRDNRYCHVFDCGLLSDDVLATIGQSFSIMQEAPDLADPKRLYQKTPMTLPRGATLPKDSTLPKTVPGVGNPLYRAQGGANPAVVALQAQGMYDNDEGETYDTRADGQPIYDLSDARASMKRPSKTGLYDNAPVNPSAFKDFLNEAVPSGHIYGGEDSDKGTVYGDGRAEWNHLDVKPEGDYATLPALKLAELYGDN